MNADTIAPIEPKRDRYGRYLIQGEPYTRATTITKTLSDTYGLTNWKMRMVANGIGQRTDLHALAATLNPDTNKKELDRVCQDAMDAASASSGANIGTALHKATEIVDAGGKCPKLPSDFNKRIQLYTDTIHKAGIVFHPDHIEQILVCTNWNGDQTAPPIAGTADRGIATLPDGRRIIADLKTGRNLDYSWQEISMQLAIYANHNHTYNPTTDRLGPPLENLDTTIGLIIHLPSAGPQTCDLYLIDLTAGIEAVDYALWVRNWRKRNGLAQVYRPNPTSKTNRGGQHAINDWLRERIAALSNKPDAVRMLLQLWPETIPKPMPHDLDSDQTNQMDTALNKVESAFDIPFSVERPGKTNTKQPKGKN